MDTLKNFINGEFVAATVNASEEVINPATLEVLGQTPLCNATDINNAVASAKQAFETWSKTPVIDRVQPLFRLKSLLEEHTDEIAKIIIDEHGKTYKEAQGDLLRGIQMVEIACGMPTMMMGESLTNIAPNIDCNTTRRSIGVFAAITP
ncbi:MAG: aldehyde dehydrogenase family protein, partial [Bdellovibrionales bacterium]|nr:aldehyde dehydrogenase family protein [Bdellovibrionales bacterium]